MSDIMRTIDLHPNDPAAGQVKAVLQTFWQRISMKVTLPLMQLKAAHGDMEEFIQSHLQELSLQTESRELIGALSQKLTNHTSWVQQLVQVPELMEEEVSLQVIIGLGAHQPLEANFFPGILEGLVGRLSLAPPSVLNPPTSVPEGMVCHWAVALREAIQRTEGRDIDLGWVASSMVPHRLHLDYNMDFQHRRVDDVAPTFTFPLLSSLVGSLQQFERPEVPREPASFKTDENLWGHGRVPPKPDLLGPSHDEGITSKRPASEGEAQGTEPPGQGESHQDQPCTESEQDYIAEIVISEDDESTIKEPQGSSTPRSEPDQCQKQSPEDQSPHPSPAKKRATKEEEKSMPQQEAALPRGVKEEDILPKRYETFTADSNWVQHVRGSLLGLEDGATPSKEDINTSECFMPHAAASELEPPEVVTDHWLPILWEEGLLAECPLDQFTAAEDWVPLFTPEGLKKHLLVAVSAFVSTEPPSLTAVVPPQIHMGLDKEFLLTSFHRHECLVRQSINIGRKHRQLAFCPYCGVVNENSETTLSHVRKYLDLLFLCGGCYVKSFPHGQALNKHMRTMCHATSAIREKAKTPRK